METGYEVVCLDHDGYDLARSEVDTLRDAKKLAKRLLDDPEYKGEASKTEVRNSKGECLVDYFV